jgi:hypothetical protein
MFTIYYGINSYAVKNRKLDESYALSSSTFAESDEEEELSSMFSDILF